MTARQFQVAFDCADADVMSAFWALALDDVLQPPPDGFDSWDEFLAANVLPAQVAGSLSAIVDPDGSDPRILFLQVPEAKTVKNRVHLDLRAGGAGRRSTESERRELADRLVASGAIEVEQVDDDGESWIVMRDPEGNEFCVT